MPPSSETNKEESDYILIDNLPPVNEPECCFEDENSQNFTEENNLTYDPLGLQEANKSPNKPQEGVKLPTKTTESDMDKAYGFDIKDDEAYKQRQFGDEDAKVATDTKLEETKDYYQRPKVSRDDMGKETQKEYEKDRKVRERIAKHELVQKNELPKKPRRMKEEETDVEKTKKEKKEIIYGSEEYPLRLANKEGKLYLYCL